MNPQRGAVIPQHPSVAPARPPQPTAPHTPTPQSQPQTPAPTTPNTPSQPTPQPPLTPLAPEPPVTPSTPQTNPPIIPPELQPPVPLKPVTDEEKAKQLAESLKTKQNSNTAYFVSHDNQHRVALWTKGITAPRLGKNGELKRDMYTASGHRYADEYLPFDNQTRHMDWFDADKSPNYTPADINLCYAAVSANQLHWWMAQNKQRINQCLIKTNYAASLTGSLVGGLQDLRIYQDSFKSQQNSTFFTMFKTRFGSNQKGYQVDPLNDLFINGYKPRQSGGVNQEHWPTEFDKDPQGGFFHSVFGRKILTDRLTASQLDYFAKQMRLALQQGKSVGVIYAKGGGYRHVITAWGVEFDQNGKLTALYITDSDYVGQDYNGLRHMLIKNIDGRAALSNNLDNPRHGSKIDRITTLGLGNEQWDAFLD